MEVITMKKLLFVIAVSMVLLSAVDGQAACSKGSCQRTPRTKQVVNVVKPAAIQTCTQNVCKRCRKK